jgi:hypothetical protein
MAAEPKSELILQNLKTSLQGIDGSDPYWTTVASVRLTPSVPQDLEGEEKPGLLIIPSGEPTVIEHKPDYHDRRVMHVGIIGVLSRAKSDDGTALRRLMKDISVAVMADVTRGGNATMTKVDKQLDASNIFGDLSVCEIELSIIYHCDGRVE